MTRRRAWGIGLVLLALVLAPAAIAAPPKDAIVIGLLAEPVTMDPPQITDLNSTRVIKRMFEGLTAQELGTYKIVPGLVIGARVDGPHGRLDTQGLEQRRGRANPHDAFRRVDVRQLVLAIAEDRERTEHRRAWLEGEVVGRGEAPSRRGVRRGKALIGEHQAIRLRVRQGPKEYRVDNRQDGGVGADAERKRGHRDDREPRRSAKRADCKPGIAPEVFESGQAPSLTHVFPQERHVAEGTARALMRRSRRS